MRPSETPTFAFDGFRTDTDDLWRMTDVVTARLKHTPFIALIAGDGAVRLSVIDRAAQVALLPDATPVFVQWRGEWRSDCFLTTAGEVKQRLAARQ